MKKLYTFKGEVVLVDNKDFDFLNKWRWHFHNRAVSRQVWDKQQKKRKQISLHRFLMGFPKGKDVDHINGNPLDNRRANLRVCEHSENVRNYSRPRNNTSGYKGVSRIKATDKWQAYIKFNNEHIHLGIFGDILEAARAYNAGAKRYFGNFAKLNTI